MSVKRLFMNNYQGKYLVGYIFQIVLLVGIIVPCGQAQTMSSGSAWKKVPPVDWSKLKPEYFADDELDLPYYLSNFQRVANSVVETGENRGFIDISVWRNQENNKPYNARIMENILSLAFFYSTKRPWNQYYASPEVRTRLEAALNFWCDMQNADGRFSEYGPKEWNLAATAFATKFMGQTLTLLREGGAPVDEKLLARTAAADRKAIHFVLTDANMYQHGKDFTNQYTNAWAGGLAYVKLYPDAEISTLLNQNIQKNSPVFQSRAGYFYEAGGPDWGYNLGTHHSNLAMAWHYTHGTALGKILAAEERSYVEWLAYNAVREPDGTGYVLNRAIETRQRKPSLDSEALITSQEAQGQRLLGSEVELARAFLPSREDINAVRAKRRAEIIKNWANYQELGVGTFSAFSPYAFLHRSHENFYPTKTQAAAAVKLLPYLNRRQFIHQRVDNRSQLTFTFVRQPSYYAIFNSGPHLTAQQRYGLGLVWRPETGTLVQSQTGTVETAWGTVLGERPNVYEAETLDPDFSIDGRVVTPEPGNRDLPAGTLTVKYRFSDQGEKVLVFEPNQIKVKVQHSGALRENIPLLVGKNDKLAVKDGEVQLTQGNKVFSIKFDKGIKAETVESKLTVGQRRVVTVVLKAQSDLSYQMSF